MSLDTRNPCRLPAHRRRELELSRADLENALFGARRYCLVQSTLAIPNEAGASFRADTNTAHQANATFQAGASAPGTTYADQYWWDATNQVLKKRNQANSAWLLASTFGTRDETFVISRSSNSILGLSDIGKTFYVTGTFSQTFTAAATLGDGWFCFYRNDGTGVITLDPNASETIDGATTIALQPGEACRIACNGSLFKTQRRVGGVTGNMAWGTGIANFGTITTRKTADQPITSSTTLTNDSDLTFPIAANEEWVCTIEVSAGSLLSTTGYKLAVTVPAGATMQATAIFNGDGGTSGSGRQTTSGSLIISSAASAGNSTGTFRITVWILNGGTAGNVTLQWAQGTSSGTALTFFKGSQLNATRFA